MPEDVGGPPYPDGEEPEHHHGAADDEFAALVLDEDFVRSASIHEPTAVERILAAAQSHTETETVRGLEDAYGYGPGGEGEFGLEHPPGTAGETGARGLTDADDDPEAEADEDEADDDEGRFDRSDYTRYLEPGDGDEFDPYEAYGPYGPYGPYVDPAQLPYEYDAFGESGHYGPYQYGRFAPYDRYDQYERYIRFGGSGSSDPRYDVGEEHGSDFRRRPAHARRSASRRRTYRGHARWQRPVAWLLALVMGISMVALALSAVYRGASQQRQDPSPPPATTGVDSSGDSGATQRLTGVPAQPPSG